MKKSFALLVLTSVMLLAGCGKTDKPSTSPTKPTTSTTEKPTTTGSGPAPTTSTVTPTTSLAPEKIALPAPVVTVGENSMISWDEVIGADYYLVFVDDSLDGIEVVGTSYKVPLKDSATSRVRVQAMAEDDNETYKNSELSIEVTVTHQASTKTSWFKDEFVSDWSTLDGNLSTLNEGLDLKAGQSIAILKKIDNDTKHFNLFLRDFEGQESEENETGAKVQLKVNNQVVRPVNIEADYATLDKNCGREILVTYDLSSFIDDEVDFIRVSEISNYSNHCVITYAQLGDYTSKFDNTTLNNYWGRNYSYSWSSEMAHADGMDDFANIADDENWIRVGSIDNINEGLKLQKEASIVRYIKVTENNSMMTLAVRNFGGADEDYAGGVSVNGTFLKAIGDEKTYFTKKTSATYFEGASDGGEVATMKTYDLSAYIGKTVCLTIANLKCYAIGGNEDLVIGSVSFTRPIQVANDDSVTFDASTSKDIYPNLPFMVAGPSTVYNEGVSFRTNDFAGGIAQRFDLSNVAEGKKVYVKTYWRSLCDDNIRAKFQKIEEGQLVETYSNYLLRDKEDNLACIGFDLSSKVGGTADIAVHIPSRNYRVVLTKIEYYVTDTAEDNLSYMATEDQVIEDLTNGEFAWGHNYKDNWGGEMGDDNLKYPKLLESGWTSNGDVNDGFGEGCKIGHGATISKTLTIDDKHETMAFSARSFGANFKGEVTLKDANNEDHTLKAIGYTTEYFTQNDAATHLDSVEDGCQNAVMYAYDLSAYKNQEVTITIKNLAGELTNGDQDADGYDDRLIVGSIGFMGILKVVEGMEWDASTIKGTNNNKALQVIPCGPFSIYNEGINFRTQDFASGITRSFDLSDSALGGKTVKVRVGFRNFSSDGEDIALQCLLNGALAKTENMRVNETEQFVEFDLTPLVGQSNVNLGIHIPSRTYRICLTKLQVVVE